MRQFKRALRHLEREMLVELGGGRSAKGRFERFRLLDEGGVPTRAGARVRYTVPIENDEVIDVPVRFFTSGWVHVLSPAEIATYLILLDLKKIHPDVHDAEGVFLSRGIREARYKLSRDAYESHLNLARYGLIVRLHNPNRREDGKVATFREPPSPHRFQIAEHAFLRWGLEVVSKVLNG
ncbi:hypothetical protein [Nonomuraea maritima]|uniref:hypothetical protein n=1 Tax=Nonomuraea maritima TaxID=683260 RepID=UPI00115FBF15|nr:hypothetical protein [Nonomuraea maritima]